MTNTYPARSIPACAGNTYPLDWLHPELSVHPRVCGEHFPGIGVIVPFCGSSPRVRGTLNDPVLTATDRRFIPACAGNTGALAPMPCINAVHPRVCGEHALLPGHGHIISGSSPRVRGTPEEPTFHAAMSRFIPACAGNTLIVLSSCWVNTVHPRVCGEHEINCRCGFKSTGSSPRVRGTRISLYVDR